MLKTQYPTDYLKKEGVNSEINEQQEKQYIGQVASKDLKQKSRLKRSLDNPDLPDNFEIKPAIGGGDCFFDSVAQGLKQLKPEMDFTVKSLREVCKKFAQDQLSKDLSWLKEALKNEAEPINHYIPRIEFTAVDITQRPEPVLLGLNEPIWGRTEIEGRIICKKYNVKLHVTEKHNVQGEEIWIHQIVDESGSRSIDDINYNEASTIHIVNKGHLHFEPILNKERIRNTVQQQPKQSSSGSHQSNLDNQLADPIGSKADPSKLQQRRSRSSDFSDYDDEVTPEKELINTIKSNDSEEEKLEKIRKLFAKESKPNINSQDKGHENDTPLHIAVRRKELKVIELLIENGADINIKNDRGRSPLDIAERLNRQDIVQALEARQASIGQSSAQQHHDSVNNRADSSQYQQGPSIEEELEKENGANIHTTNDRNKSPLDIATRLNRQDIVQALETQSDHQASVRVQSSGSKSIEINQDASKSSPVFSEELKVDEGLKLSKPNFKSLIENSIQPAQDKLNELKKTSSYPTDYVFAELAHMVYKVQEDGKIVYKVQEDGKIVYEVQEDGKNANGEDSHGKDVLKDWQLLTTAYNPGILGSTIKTNGYFGAAYWNPAQQQVIIAHRGTKLLNTGALLADINGIVLNKHVAQIDSAIKFTDDVITVLKEINSGKNVYLQLFFTGHSLGGWLAQITTFTAKYVKKVNNNFLFNENFQESGYNAHAMVFDSPGCKNKLLAMQDKLMERYRYSSSPLNSLDIISYFSTPNFINTFNYHVGSLYRVFLNLPEEMTFWQQNFQYTSLTHKMENIKEVFDHSTGEVLRDTNGALRIQKVLDWPLLGTEQKKEYWEKILGYVKGLLPSPFKEVVTVVNTVASLQRYKKEYNDFFKWANQLNNFDPNIHPQGTSFRVQIGEGEVYYTIRYQTKPVNEDYKKEHSTNAFTKPELQFLKRYQSLRELSGLFKPEDLFPSPHFDQASRHGIVQMLESFAIEGKVIRSNKLQGLIPYVKRVLYLFPEVKSNTKKVQQDLPINIRNEFYQKETSSYVKLLPSLDFKDDTIGLNDFLKSDNLKILQTVHLDTSLGATKIYKTFNKLEESGYKGNKHHAFLNLERVFHLGGDLLIQFLKDVNDKYLLVIECESDYNFSGEVKGFFERLFETVRNFPNTKIVLVTQQGSNLSDGLKRLMDNEQLYKIVDNVEIKFSDLTDSSQNKLLEKKIVFQGKEGVSLSKLIDNASLDEIIDSETIIGFAQDEKIEIGKALPNLGEVEDYYIGRIFNHKIKIREEAFKAENLLDLFAISNTSKDELLGLVNRQKVRDFGENDPDKSMPIRFITLDNQNAEENFRQICEDYSESILHWVKKESDGSFIWQRSHGTLSALREYVDGTSVDIKINSINNFNGKFIVVAAEPGMGKSTALTHLGIQEQKINANISKWIIRINLVEYKDRLKQVSFNNLDDAIKFLHKHNDQSINTLSSKLTNKLLQSRLNDRGNIIFLLDGFDEITNESQKNVIQLLKILQNTKAEKILVSTRLHVRNELEDNLSTFAYTFKPFSQKNQEQFLKRFWQKDPDIRRENEIRLSPYIEKLLEFISHSIRDKEREFMGIPLQMKMIAEAFQKNVKESLGNNQELILPEDFDILKLYDRFIRAKYEIYFKEKIRIGVNLNEAQEYLFTINFTKMHRRLALKVLFPEMEEGFVGNKLPSESEEQELKSIGIIQLVNNEVMFVHRTFSEYFVADLLASILKEKKENNPKHKIVREFLAKEIFQGNNEIIKTFLDYHLAKEEIHIAAFKGQSDVVSRILSENSASLDNVDYLGRQALHYAAQEGHEEVVNALLENDVDVKVVDEIGKIALHYAARYNYKNANTVSRLLESTSDYIDLKDKNERTSVYYAAEQGNWGIVKLLIERGASIDGLGREVLLFHYTFENNLSLVKTFVKQGTNVDIQDNLGNTPLHIAVQRGYQDMVRFFVEKGVNINIVNIANKSYKNQ